MMAGIEIQPKHVVDQNQRNIYYQKTVCENGTNHIHIIYVVEMFTK
jgi:hypothetical protein